MRPRTPIRGDHSQRVTVPLPQTLNDLRSYAKSHFGHPGRRLKMYHREKEHDRPLEQQHYRPLEQQHDFMKVGDNDVVIVREETPDLGRSTFKMTTTNQATFVEHPIERKQPSGPRLPDGSGLKPPAFQGRSCYAGDYVEHPIGSLDMKKPPAVAWEPHSMPMTSRSTYTENFPWHSVQRTGGQKRPTEKNYEANPAPFHGQSSYRMDYIKREGHRPTSAKATGRRNTRADPNVPFDGTTTYSVDFKEYPPSPTKRAHPSEWKLESGPSPPFKGSSEYQTEYLKRQMARGLRIHIEPEDKHERAARRSS